MRPVPGISSRKVMLVRMATDTDDTAGKETTTSDATTDIQVPKFDSSDFEETDSGSQFDWFSV